MTDNNAYYKSLTDEKERKLLGACRMYIASVNGGVAMEYIRIKSHVLIADVLDQDSSWKNHPLCDILHGLDKAIGFPIKPSQFLPDQPDHPYFKHPDRNLSDIELVEKYEIKLFELLREKFMKDDKK